jgi:hypothetical protein
MVIGVRRASSTNDVSAARNSIRSNHACRFKTLSMGLFRVATFTDRDRRSPSTCQNWVGYSDIPAIIRQGVSDLVTHHRLHTGAACAAVQPQQLPTSSAAAATAANPPCTACSAAAAAATCGPAARLALPASPTAFCRLDVPVPNAAAATAAFQQQLPSTQHPASPTLLLQLLLLLLLRSWPRWGVWPCTGCGTRVRWGEPACG